MVEVKLEVGNNATNLAKLLLYIVIAGMVISAAFFAVMLLYFMFFNPLS